jgi:NAD(P)-dependent dehydrogenase (short-subunit alcohol dehydrogenase family)
MTHKNLTVMPLDVTDEHQTERVFKQAIAKLDRIDLVVNNAGLGMVRAIEEVSTEEAQATLDTNFFGTFNVIRAVVPHFRANHSGHIINFSSVGGITGSAGYGVYNAAKFAVEGLSEALDLELRPFGIKVTIVEPGYFRTEFLSSGSIKKAAKLVDAYADTVGKASNNVSSGGRQPTRRSCKSRSRDHQSSGIVRAAFAVATWVELLCAHRRKAIPTKARYRWLA